MPEHESAAPTSIALSSLGSLMSIKIFLKASFSGENIFRISFRGTETLPREIEIKNVTTKIKNKENIMVIFLDNNK